MIYESQHKLYNYPLVNSSLTDEENDYLEKYLDVTKSQLFFAKGVIFVEGISEAILIPEFAKLINRPLDMYAVELVNINGVGFAPFAKMIKVPGKSSGFAKASIITDDDRCSNKNEPTYISKDLDYDDDLTGIIDKIDHGTPSTRFNSITALCGDNVVKCFGAVKTFEYALALEPNNIEYTELMRILFLGRLVPEKGIRYLVEAFKNVKTDKKLVIAGGSSDTDSFMEELKELAKGDDRILFTGFVQGAMLDELYSNAYIYTLPSDLEGMPLSLLEAMSYGNCCLVSDIPECAEVVEDKALIFKKSDVEDLREKLQDACDHPEMVMKMKNQAADFICEKYNWDEVVRETMKLYTRK